MTSESGARLPRHVADRAVAVAYGDLDTWTPPAPRDAATVVLLRDADDGPEVFLMRRQRTMAFAAGMSVFPGGAVDASDAHCPWSGPVGADVALARALSADDAAAARSLVVAAVREVAEEAGVLLARRGGEPVALPAGVRVGLADRSLAFADLLMTLDAAVDPIALPPWGHWVTPEVEDRRYDTRFFVAALPPGQQADGDGDGEADRLGWWRPIDAVTAYAEGRLPMLPPTIATLHDLTAYRTVAEIMSAAPDRIVRPWLPRPVVTAEGRVAWHLVDARTGEVLVDDLGEPSGSEVAGVRVDGTPVTLPDGVDGSRLS